MVYMVMTGCFLMIVITLDVHLIQGNHLSMGKCLWFTPGRTCFSEEVMGSPMACLTNSGAYTTSPLMGPWRHGEFHPPEMWRCPAIFRYQKSLFRYTLHTQISNSLYVQSRQKLIWIWSWQSSPVKYIQVPMLTTDHPCWSNCARPQPFLHGFFVMPQAIQ